MNIIIISEPRTGSGLLAQTLRCFNGFRNLGVMFYHHHNDHLLFSTEEYGKIYKNRDISPQELFTRVCDIIPPVRVIKVHMSHYEKFGLDFLLTIPDTYFILLERRDKLRQYVSFEMAKITGRWSGGTSNNDRIAVNINKYLEYKSRSIHNYNNFRKILSNHNYLDISYEDVLSRYNKTGVLVLLKRWLNSNGVHVLIGDYIPNKTKQETRDIRDVVLNYDRVCMYDR